MSKQSRKLRLREFLPYRLSVLANTVSGTIAETYAEQFSISIREWRVIAIIAEEEGLTARDIVGRTAMDKVAVSRAVSRLIEKGHLRRTASPTDGRATHLYLTAKGRNVYDKVSPRALAYEDTLLRELSAADRKMLDRLLTLLTDRASALAPRE